MIHFLSLTLITTLLLYNTRNGKFKYSLEFAFLLITIFAALRFEFGVDYPDYLSQFYFYNDQGYSMEDSDRLRTEVGWLFLTILFKPLGFFAMVAILSVLEQFIVYYIIKKFVDVKYYWFAVFSYLISVQLYLTGLSMMRQFLAMSVCLIAFNLLLNRRFVIGFSLIALASLFHLTALVVLPFSAIFILKDVVIGRKRVIAISFSMGILIFASYFMSGNQFLGMIQSTAFERYENYVNASTSGKFGVSTIFNWICWFIVLMYQCKQDRELRYLTVLFLFSGIFLSLSNAVPILDRTGLYFMILLPICYSSMLKYMPKNYAKFFIFFFIVIRLYNYYSFVTSGGWGSSFYEYKTIFDTPSIL